MKGGLMRTRIANGDWRRSDRLTNVANAVSAKDACNAMEIASRDSNIPTFLIDAGPGKRVPIIKHLTGGDESIAMPYQSMWIESAIYYDDGGTGRFAILADNPNNYAREEPRGAVVLHVAICASNATLTGVVTTVLVAGECDDRGVMRPLVSDGDKLSFQALPHLKSLQPENSSTQELAEYLGTNAMWDSLYLITMLSCRNVEVVKREHPGEYDRKRRKFKGGYQYHTVVVRNKDKRIVYDPDPLAPESPAALHMVRGHFKTYTSEAPLMGKLTGRYYWPPHARGSRDVGEIEHEYRVG